MPRAALSSVVGSLLLHAALPLSAAFKSPPQRYLPVSWVALELMPAPSPLEPLSDVSAPMPEVLPRAPARAPSGRASSASRPLSAAAVPTVPTSSVPDPEGTEPALLAARAKETAEPAVATGGEPAAPSVAALSSGVAAVSANGAPAFGRAVPRAGGGLGSPQVDAERSRYMRALRARVVAHREYPYLARRVGLEGTVCLRVSVTAAGEVSELHATCGASASALLESALRAVRSAAPFGPLPPVLGRALTVDVPVVFQLDAASADGN
jgi:protein TonB